MAVVIYVYLRVTPIRPPLRIVYAYVQSTVHHRITPQEVPSGTVYVEVDRRSTIVPGTVSYVSIYTCYECLEVGVVVVITVYTLAILIKVFEFLKSNFCIHIIHQTFANV